MKSTVKNPMRSLFRYLGPNRRLLNFSILSSVLNKIVDLMPPLIVGWAVDAVNGQTPAWIYSIFGVSTPFTIALFFALFIVVAFFFESVFEWLFGLGFKTLAQRVQHRLRVDAYNQLQHREVAFFEQQRTGNIMAILNDDINQLERFLNDSFNQIVQLITLYCFAAFAMGAVSWKLTLISLFPIPLILLGSFFYQRKIEPFYGAIRHAVGALSSRLENNISGVMVIKSFTAEKYEAERVEQASEAYKQANIAAIRWNTLYVPIIRMFVALGFAVGMFLGAYWTLSGMEGFTAGNLAFFSMMIQRILWPITRLGHVFDEYARAKASASRVFELLETPNQLPQASAPQKPTNVHGVVAVKEVHFSYDPKVPILKGISFEVPEGHTIGIAGTTGSGKTTLIKLLMRLYDTSAGSILVDGVDVRNWDLKYLRKQIAIVSQDVYLFHGTILENISYGMEVGLEEVQNAAKQAQLHAFIVSLPDGYNTLVGERGIKLSGGQRQRLSIARALLKNAPILILDEATSAVDTETERAIQQNLKLLTTGRTAFIIAHRLSTIRHANTILVLRDGAIIERGTHKDLLASKGVYSELWNVQIGEMV